jgi:hypothetical protein
MKYTKWIFAALAAVLCDVQASGGGTWLLSKFETPTSDSAETNAIYGYQVFSNDASKADVKVADSAVHLIATTIASEGTEGYSANLGLMLPLTPDWAEYDLTGLTKITFEYMNDTKITDVLSVSFGSSAYSEEIADAGTVFSFDISGSMNLNARTTWKEFEVRISDFATPTWWTNIPADFPTLGEVLKKVKNLQFAPKPLYRDGGVQKGVPCTRCVTPTMPSVTLKIRNIVLHGVGEPRTRPFPNDTGIGCDESVPKFDLDGFASGTENTLGGDWFVFSDFDSTGISTDPSTGSTTVSDSIHADGPYLAMNAQLRKRNGGNYHRYAGWAAIGTNFGQGGAMDATGLTGIGFHLADLGINADLVQTIDFKVKMRGVDDAAIHQVRLPVAVLVEAKAAGKSACIRPSDLVQPGYVQASHRMAFDPKAIEQISWEAKITDDRNPTIDTASAKFRLAKVVLHGVAAPSVGVRLPVRAKTFVSYTHGRLEWGGFAGATRFEVRRLDGTRLASFDATSRPSMMLPRGAYLLTALGSKSSVSHRFAVVQP